MFSFLNRFLKPILENPLLRRVLKNSAYLFSASGMTVALSFFQNLLTSNILGPALLGVLGVIVRFTSIINKLASFRMNEMVVKYVGQFREEGNPQKSAAVFKLACLLEAGSSLVSFGVIALLAGWAARIFARDVSFASLFLLYGLIVVGNLIFESSSGLLQISDRFRSISILQAMQGIVTLALIPFALISDQPIVAVVLAYMAGKLLIGLGVALMAFGEGRRQWGRGWWRTPLGALKGQYREIFRFAFSTNISATINLVNKDGEELWVAGLLGATASGYYKQALAIANLVLIPVSPLPNATYPELAREAARKAWDNVRYVLKQGSRLAALYTGLASLFLIIFGRQIIALLYPQFQQSYPALVIILIGLFAANTFYWNRTALLALNLPDYPLKVNTLAAVLKIALTLLLVPHYGILASAALLSGYYVFSIGLNVRKTYRELAIRDTGARDT
jgi:O-antigen/teichoic acid export membrane protein